MEKANALEATNTNPRNLCLRCFLDSESMLLSEMWNELPDGDPKKNWCEILDKETKKIRDILILLNPLKILEIGCGTGRIIHQIMETSQNRNMSLELVVGFEQNPTIYEYANARFSYHPKVHILRSLFGQKRTSYASDFFDLGIAVSNIVGWQKSEKEFIGKAFFASRNLLLTVYRKGLEYDRKKIYEALGDKVWIDKDKNIWIEAVDCFRGKPHISKSYTRENLEKIIDSVLNEFKGSTCELFEISDYMFGCLLRKHVEDNGWDTT